MARSLRLGDLSPDQRRVVYTNTAQIRAFEIIRELIEQLRVAKSTADYYAFERALVGNILVVEDFFNHASHMSKRQAKGLSAGDPVSNSWAIDRLIYKRILSQLRSLGDALAWKLLEYDRSAIAAFSNNDQAGIMTGKEGLDTELAFVRKSWEETGVLLLLNDATNCIRIGDVIQFSDDGPRPFELKKTKPRVKGAQRERMLHAIDTITTGAPLRFGSVSVSLNRVSQPHQTRLPALEPMLDEALVEGAAGVVLDDGWCALARVIATDRPCRREPKDVFREEEARVRQEAHIDGGAAFPLTWSSEDGLFAPWSPPYALYPFSPDLCARLTCEWLELDSRITFECLARPFQAAGYEVSCETGHEELVHLNDPVLTFGRDGGSHTFHTVELLAIAVEFLDPDTFALGIYEVLRGGLHPQFITFADERRTWS